MKINLENDRTFISMVNEGLISVSNKGVVKNLKTKNTIGYYNKSGYFCIGVKKHGKVVHILVHRLVYIIYKYKMKPLPFIVNHRDGVKSNNYYKNLERSNHSHNLKHAFDNNLIKISTKTLDRLRAGKGELNPRACLTNDQANKIRALYKTGNYSHRSLGVKYGISHRQIGKILRNETYCV